MHVIAARLLARDGCEDELLETCRAMLAPSREEAGCIAYRLYVDPFDRRRIFFYEEWRGRAAIDYHFSTLHFREFQKRIGSLIDGEPDIAIHEVASSESP